MEDWHWWEQPCVYIQADPSNNVACASIMFKVTDKTIWFRRISWDYTTTPSSWMPTADDEEFKCYFHSLAYPLLRRALEVLSPNANPSYAMCRRRLLAEFRDLTSV